MAPDQALLDGSPAEETADSLPVDAVIDAALQPEIAKNPTGRQRRPSRRVRSKPDAAAPARPLPLPKQLAKVPFGSKFKRAIVVVDGKKMGAIAGMQMAPIALEVGQRDVLITNEPTCKPERTTLQVRPGKNKKVRFFCREKRDARVVVRTRTAGMRLKVRTAKDNRRRGLTNVVFRVPMTDLARRETLTVGEGNQYSEHTVQLKAGEEVSITIER